MLVQSFSIQILGFKVTRDFTINNSRGCHVTSSCVINISTVEDCKCVAFELYLIERLLLLKIRNFDSRRCFNVLIYENVYHSPFDSIYINHLRHLFNSFLSLFCLFPFFLSSYNTIRKRILSIFWQRATRKWWTRMDSSIRQKCENFEVSKTRGNVMNIHVTILFTTVALS